LQVDLALNGIEPTIDLLKYAIDTAHKRQPDTLTTRTVTALDNAVMRIIPAAIGMIQTVNWTTVDRTVLFTRPYEMNGTLNLAPG